MPTKQVLTWMHLTGKVLWLQACKQGASGVASGGLGAVMSCYVPVEERDRLELFEYSVSNRQAVEKTREGQVLYKTCGRAEFCVR